MYRPAQLFRDEVLGELPLHGQYILSGDGQPQGFAVVFEDGVHLLHNDKLFYFTRKFLNEPDRQRVGHPQFEHGHSVPKDLFHILVRSRGSDNPHLGSAHLHPIDWSSLRPLLKLLGTLLHKGVAADGIAGHHNIFSDVLLIGLTLGLCPAAGFHQGLGVGHPGTHLQQHWGIELLADRIGQLGKLQRLGGVGGLQHGHLSGNGVMTGVLLILRGVHPRVVGHADHQSCVHPGIGHGIQRVGSYVQPHMLHCTKGPFPRQTGPEGGLQSHLLVGRPFTVDFGKFYSLLGNLRAGGAGIAGDHTASRLIQSSGNGGVAQHQLFHTLFLLSF